MEFDLLLDDQHKVFAVNCTLKDESLLCGALYLEPRIAGRHIRLSHNTASLEIELPHELLDQSSAYRAWDVELPVTNEQVRQPAVHH